MSQVSFLYRAIDRQGEQTRGVLTAADRADAFRRISAAGMRPLRIRQARTRRGRRGGRVSLKDLAHLTYQFAVLIEARIPISDGLRSIAEQESSPRLAEVLEDIAHQIESGCSVTDALSPYHDLFGEVYIETIRAAEVSGNMIQVLNRLATMLEQQYEATKSFRGALIYPIAVVATLALAVTFLVVTVVPKFGAMFAARGVELPAITQGLLACSGFVRSYWYALLGGLITAGFTGRHLRRSREWRTRVDRWLHAVPAVRHLLKGVAVSRFAHVFGVSIQSGLSLIDAIELAGRASGRPLLQGDARKMANQVNQGGRLVDVMMSCEYLPAFARRMLAAGEEAGDLARMCEIVARHYDREVTHLTKNVATLIEPILIVGLAGVVLIVALAIFLPMWNMAAVMS